MTSDAKIGLLLGLVFIFIIAFVINGLPRFRSTTNGSELTTNMVRQNDPLGIGDRERKVQNLIDWPELPAEDSQSKTQTVEPAAQIHEDIRYQRPLPDIVPYTPIVEIPEQTEPAPIQPVDPLPTDSTESTIAKLFDPPAPTPPREQKIEIKKPPRPANTVSPKVYVVSDGDNLAKIAQKFYGIEEGNKRANIMRIYELNRSLLTSPDELQIGQKLVIPPPSVSQAEQNKLDRLETASFFEKVESIGRKLLQDDKKEKTPSRPIVSTGGQYVVKEGDNLWRIATEQLGNGSRYKEIAKLNADTLKDENSLQVGTTLKMPAR